ncbi:Protein HAPLESS 2 [Acorus gramineus]|uniref:Protein HAPLESS 2 n=1 Tax=Acorus gramineus TaxID=55184 RepID=A0AAV9AD16_ACOGR|nr:Protein HAPLESS 2 [Acorus gramineus]
MFTVMIFSSEEMTHKFLLFLLFALSLPLSSVDGVEILSKSRLERCEKVSESDNLICEKKIVVNLAVPSGSSGGEASIVAELVEVEEENSTQKMQTIRTPPVITVNKSAAYALYEITYIRDVPYKPEEYFVKTRKCEPDASAKIVKICERGRRSTANILKLNGDMLLVLKQRNKEQRRGRKEEKKEK